jgi:hypothetical protein
MIKLKTCKQITGGRLKNSSQRCCLSRSRRWLRRVSTRTCQEHKSYVFHNYFYSFCQFSVVCFSDFHLLSTPTAQTAALRKVVNPHLSLSLRHTCRHRAPMSRPVTPQLLHYASRYSGTCIYQPSNISEFEFGW